MCQSFFKWVQNEGSQTGIAETVWKNEMFFEASRRFPQHSYAEIEKMVNRDWGVMPEKEKQKVIESVLTAPARTVEYNIKRVENEIKKQTSNAPLKIAWTRTIIFYCIRHVFR